MKCQKVFEESTSFLPQNSWWMLGSDPYIKNQWTLASGLKWRVKNDLFVKQENLWKDPPIYLIIKPKCIVCHVKFESDASLSRLKENLNIKQRLFSMIPACASTHLSLSMMATLVNLNVFKVLFLHTCHLHTWPQKSASVFYLI